MAAYDLHCANLLDQMDLSKVTRQTGEEAMSAPRTDRAESAEVRHSESVKEPASWWTILRTTFSNWTEDSIPRHSAALAYYTVFSLAPILIFAVAIAAFVLDQSEVHDALHGQLEQLFGSQSATAVESMIDAANQPGTSIVATLTSLALLLLGASGVFVELRDALNTIWGVSPKRSSGWWRAVRERFLSFAMVLSIGFLLLVSLIVSTALASFGEAVSSVLPASSIVLYISNALVSIAVISLLFALIFKVLPDAPIAWRDVVIGSVATAVLFSVGKFGIGMYLGRGSVSSAYGAAGSVAVILLWAYYSSMILFLGAEFTQAYSDLRGSQMNAASRDQAKRLPR